MSSFRVDVVGSVGYLTLAQPSSLNALTQSMIDALTAGLRSHESNVAVAIIVIRSDSERAFCAGGEMKQLRNHALNSNATAIASFFKGEYALNLAIATCSKPYLAIIDGIAMGGGLGLSVHGRFRVVTEHAVMAMPESRIGFFPDVGGSYFLPRLPYGCGKWLGLTAATVKADQAVTTGLATHFIKRSAIADLLHSLEALPEQCVNASQTDARPGTASPAVDAEREQQVLACLNAKAINVSDNPFMSCLEEREYWFAPSTLPAIERRLILAAENSEDATMLLGLLQGASPYSSAITLSLWERTAGLSLQACLEEEYALAMEACAHPDFVEGIRAVLVDKDRKPCWQGFP